MSKVSQAVVAAPTDVLTKNSTGLVPAWAYAGVGIYNLVFPSALAVSINNIFPQITLGQTVGFVGTFVTSTTNIRVLTYSTAGAAKDDVLLNCSFAVEVR
jgi:hypothetical protein